MQFKQVLVCMTSEVSDKKCEKLMKQCHRFHQSLEYCSVKLGLSWEESTSVSFELKEHIYILTLNY